jgi:hypothetical protein
MKKDIITNIVLTVIHPLDVSTNGVICVLHVINLIIILMIITDAVHVIKYVI